MDLVRGASGFMGSGVSGLLWVVGMRIFVLIALMVLGFSVTGLARAEAGEVSTTETTLDYARQGVARVMGTEYALVPGSMQIGLRQATVMDIGGAVRSVFGKEKVEYEVNFKAKDRAGDLFAGRTFLTVEAVDSKDTDRDQDNNTTLRGTDRGTGRFVKVQLFEYQNYPTPIDVKSFELRQLKTGR